MWNAGKDGDRREKGEKGGRIGEGALGGEGGGEERRKRAVGGRRVGEGAREEGAWVGCDGASFAGCASGRPATQECIAADFQSDMDEGKRSSVSG